MTAVADIQRALNVIRSIERDAAAETRLAALALVAGTAADIARELHGDNQRTKKRAAAKTVSPAPAPRKPAAAAPKPLPIPKPPAQSKPASPSKPLQPQRKSTPFTQPEL